MTRGEPAVHIPSIVPESRSTVGRPGQPEVGVRMPLVKVKENEPIDKAIKRFKKKCEKEGIIQDIKKSSRYLKPSERKRKKQLKAAKRRRTGKG